MVKRFLIFLFFFFTFICPEVRALTKKISGTTNIEDAYGRATSTNNNYGATTTLQVKCDPLGDDYFNAYIRVKNVTSEIGANATNITAVCSLYCGTNTVDDNISAFRIFKPWVEGDENAVDNDDGDVTWNDWASDAYEWGTAGGGCAGDDGVDNSQDGTCNAAGRDRKSTAESSVNVTTTGWKTWTISTELATGWYKGTIGERGIILVGSLDAGSNTFYSSEYTTDATKCPFFVFTYDLTAAPDTVQAEQQSSIRPYKRFLHDTTPELKAFTRMATDDIRWRVGTTLNGYDIWNQDWYNITDVPANSWTEELSVPGPGPITEGTLYYFQCKVRNTTDDSSDWSVSDTLRYVATDTIIYVNRNDTEGLWSIINDDANATNTAADSYTVDFSNWYSGGVAYWVTQDTARDNYPDSKGNYPVFNWGFIMHPLYEYSLDYKAESKKDGRNCVWDTVSALWGSTLISKGDEFTIHEHNADYDTTAGVDYWNLETTFDSTTFERFLKFRLYYGQQMDDRYGMFSMQYSGWNWGDNALCAFMNKRIRADWSNRSTGTYWGSAQEGFYPYHPATADYQTWGDMQIYIGRVEDCGDNGCLTQDPEVIAIFDSAGSISGKGYRILSVFDHDWQTNTNTFQKNFEVTYNSIKAISDSTGIPFIYLTATDAMARYFGWTDITAPTLSFGIVDADSLQVAITEDGDVYSAFPYAVHYFSADSLQLVPMVQVGSTDVWRWSSTTYSDSVIVAVVDTCGNMAIDWADRDWISGITGRRRKLLENLLQGEIKSEENPFIFGTSGFGFGLRPVN